MRIIATGAIVTGKGKEMVYRVESAKFWIVVRAISVLIFALLLYTGAASIFVSLLLNDVGDAHALTPSPSRSPLSHLDIKLSTYWASFAILAGVICACVAVWSVSQIHRFLPASRARGLIFVLLGAVLLATTVMAIISPGGTMAVPQALTCGRSPFLAGSGFLCGWNLEPGWNKLLHPDGWVGAMLRLRLVSNILFQIAVICVLVAIVVAVSVSRWEEVSPADRQGDFGDRVVARLFVAGGLVFSLRVMSQIVFGMWPIAVAANDQLSGIMVAYSVFFGVLGSSVLVTILAFSRGALFEPHAAEMGDRDGTRLRAWSVGSVALFLSRESTIKAVSTLAPVLIAAIGGPLLGKG